MKRFLLNRKILKEKRVLLPFLACDKVQQFARGAAAT